MKNSLSDRIGKKLKEKNKISKSQHKSDFLAQKSAINEAILDGWSAKIIWETLYEEASIKMSYKTFAKYVRDFCKGEKVDHHKSQEPVYAKPEKKTFFIKHDRTLKDMI